MKRERLCPAFSDEVHVQTKKRQDCKKIDIGVKLYLVCKEEKWKWFFTYFVTVQHMGCFVLMLSRPKIDPHRTDKQQITVTSERNPHIYKRRMQHSYCCRDCSPLTLPLYILFRSSCKTNIPFIWKNAFVISVRKSGPKSTASNYRPISLTSILCRILEKLVAKEVSRYCGKTAC